MADLHRPPRTAALARVLAPLAAAALVSGLAGGCRREPRVAEGIVEIHSSADDRSAVVARVPFAGRVAVREPLFGAEGWLVARDGYVRPALLAAVPLHGTDHTVVVPTAVVMAPTAMGHKTTIARVPLGTVVEIAAGAAPDDDTVLVIDNGMPLGFIARKALAAGRVGTDGFLKIAESALRARDLVTAEAAAEAALRVDPKNAAAAQLLAPLVRGHDDARFQALRALAVDTALPVPPRTLPPPGGAGYVVAVGAVLRPTDASTETRGFELSVGTRVIVESAGPGGARVTTAAPPMIVVGPGGNVSSRPPATGFIAASALDTQLPPDRTDSLVHDALAAHQLGLAASAVLQEKQRPDPRSGPPAASVSLEVFWGCRGEPSRAVEVDAPELADASLNDVCVRAIDPQPLCMTGSTCDGKNDDSLERIDRETELRRHFLGPFVRIRVHNTGASPLVGPWRFYKIGLSWSAPAGDFPGALKSAGVVTTPLPAPELAPGETVEVWRDITDVRDARLGVVWGNGEIFDGAAFTKARTDDAIACACAGDTRGCLAASTPPPLPPPTWEILRAGRVCHVACDVDPSH